MCKRTWLLAFVTLLLTFLLNPASAAANGLILGFSAGDTIALVSQSTIDHVPPPRTIHGTKWTLIATGNDGAQRWSVLIAAPRQFHGHPQATIAFSVLVPAALAGDQLAIIDSTGVERWTGAVDAALLDNAAATAAAVEQRLIVARAATAKLGSSAGHPLLHIHGEAVAPLLEANRSKPASFAAGMDFNGTASASAPGAMVSSPSKSGNAASPVFTVGGMLSINNSEVRVFDGSTDSLIASTQSEWWTSRFEVQLPRGRYVFEMDENRQRTDSPFFYRTPTRTAPIQIDGGTEVPMIQQLDQAGAFELSVRIPCTVLWQPPSHAGNSPYVFTATAVSDNGTRVQREDRVSITETTTIAGAEYCPVIYGFQLSPGRYSIELAIPGWEAMQFNDVQISDGATVRHERQLPMNERRLVWIGMVVDETEAPLNNLFVHVIREIGQPTFLTSLADPSGRFEIAYSRGWTLEFAPTPLSNRESVVRKRYALTNGHPPAKVVLNDVAVEHSLEDGLMRIHGDGNRENNYNMLFLADGYTDIQETFTDVNANGVWDAIVWYDMNGDGVFDPSEDRYGRYGDIGFDALQLPDPSVDNEPYSDLNNDQMLNINEPEEFERNAREFMRSLLGSDFFHEHKTAFNAWLLFEPSQQSGFDVTTASGQMVVERSTIYNANFFPPQSTMGISYQAAMNRALVAMPEVDMVVVLVNQNVNSRARGNVTNSQPGVMVWPSGLQPYSIMVDTGPAHEMGHFVGVLCDEYSEFRSIHPLQGNPSTGCPNTSYLNDPTQVPWSNWLSADSSAPARHFDGTLGIYDGAQYYESGAFRPSYDSIMRGLYPLFNAPSRAALEAAVHERTGEWRDPADASGRCARLPTNAIHRRDANCQ